MAEQPPASSKRTRGPYSRLICLGCHERRIKCELPDQIVVPGPGELEVNHTPCYRCKKLGVPCVVRRTRLGRPGAGDGLITLAAENQDEVPSSSGIDLPQSAGEPHSRRRDMAVPIPQPDSRSLPISRCMNPAKIQILPLRRATVPPKLPEDTSSSSSSDGRPITAKRTRASKPKVKTGCLTCKIRRIKCDETRPACLKCSSTGRKCDGYPAQPPTRSQDVARLPKPARGLAFSTLKVSPGEVRALEYFCIKTAPSLSMYFDHELWNGFIVQASVAEPAIRHAMVALSILAEQRELRDVGDTGGIGEIGEISPAEDEPAVLSFPARIAETDPMALRSYNTSVGRLSQLASSPGTTDTILLACILFVCIELLRGDAEAAIGHFKGGMAIIADCISKGTFPPPSSYPQLTIREAESSQPSRLMLDRVKTKILPVFNRLEMLYALFGNDASWQYPTTLADSVPDTFESLENARDSLVNLLNLSLRFVRTMDTCRYDPSSAIPALAFQEQSALLSNLTLWHQRFSAYRSQSASCFTSSSKDLYACNILEIQRLVAYTWVSVATTPFETSHDDHLQAYAAAVSLAENLPALASSHAQSGRFTRSFTLDVEIVGPLHWIAIKCRDPAVRRRAIAVLRGMHRHEGMWDSRMAVIIAERVAAVEEAGLGLEVGDGILPSEQARVHYSSTDSWPGVTAAGYSITHQMKPDGVYGRWGTKVEEFTARNVVACKITSLFAT